MARRHGVDKIRVFTDSELLVKSVRGEANPASPGLRKLRAEAQHLYQKFTDRDVSWVPREMNTEPDLLAGASLPLRPSRG